MKITELQNIDGRWLPVVREMTPEEEAEYYRQNPPMTPPQKRENAYETEKIVRYGNGVITVDEANKLWQQYMAEGNTEKTAELTELISVAKAEIRERYPDEVTV